MPSQRNVHWNVCLFMILFLFMWAYFHHKFVAFLLEYANVFALNTCVLRNDVQTDKKLNKNVKFSFYKF